MGEWQCAHHGLLCSPLPAPATQASQVISTEGEAHCSLQGSCGLAADTVLNLVLSLQPMPDQGSLVPDPSTTYELFDRVVNVALNTAVPFALRGTIIGILGGESVTCMCLFSSEITLLNVCV